ncbi:MAG: protein-L-isoaspartate(D-aspartate) O-methyltransferase [Candidatus Latescibacteria bacterium]|nr:protein-L-isoaspartate(D-aspartate) O-methyltransferase [Candidatus Latescibacterota bacterium]
MVNEQLKSRGIHDERVLTAMGIVPRHLFVDQAFWPRAYEDHPLPINQNQTISQPYIVALMSQALELNGGEKVLEIGTGSGYQAAILAVLGCDVYTIERHKELSKKAEKLIKKIKIKNIHFKVGDGSMGWVEEAPFNRIIVTAGAPEIPGELMNQLSPGGRIVIPVGNLATQRLMIVIKGEKVIEKHDVCGCSFVPLLGDKGWSND